MTIELVRQWLTTQELADRIGVPTGKIINMVADKVAEQWKRGKQHRGHPHKWSARQCLALTVICTLSNSVRHKGCTKQYIRRTMANFQRLSDEALFAWFEQGQGEEAPHNQESMCSIDWAG
jgi:hypothetical protein